MAPVIMPPRRLVAHPAWRNVSRQDAEELLKEAMLGEVILRPSASKGPEHVSLTWKIDDDQGRVALYQHLDIQERDQGRLYIGNECFEDMDEIIARFVEPIAAYLRDVRATSKFFSLPGIDRKQAAQQIESHLTVERSHHPERIAYCLSLARDRPGHVVLSYQPAGRCFHELVEVLPSGLRLRGQRFESVEAMITGLSRIGEWLLPPEYQSKVASEGDRMGIVVIMIIIIIIIVVARIQIMIVKL